MLYLRHFHVLLWQMIFCLIIAYCGIKWYIFSSILSKNLSKMTSIFYFTKDLVLSSFLNYFSILTVLCKFADPFKFLFCIVQTQMGICI